MPLRKRLAPPVAPREDEARSRWPYAVANSFELMTALAAVIASIVIFIDRSALEGTAVGQRAGSLGDVWVGMYGVGGLLMAVGILRVQAAVEVAGLCLFSGAVFVNAISILSLKGTTGIAAAGVYAGLALASAGRAWLVLKVMRIVGRS